ncbi:MAG: hypothetical protein MUF51_00775 [Vicinamibacteria bacterium]|nr:hypothetical protein [Vicinamibacteria bacterium]
MRLAVDRRSGLAATQETPRRYVEVRTFVDLPPRYAAWAAGAGLPRPPTIAGALPATDAAFAPGARSARVSVTSPESGLHVLRDPETPAVASTLALKAVVDPPAPQVVWYVDGRPYEVVDYPYTARWPLLPGEHVFEARLPHAPIASSRVRVLVE